MKCTNNHVCEEELGIEVVGQNMNRPIKQVVSMVEDKWEPHSSCKNAMYCVTQIDGVNVKFLVEESENLNVKCDNIIVFSLLEDITLHASHYATT